MKGTSSKIPVTTLTGFLGSGKTTLLNRILTADHGLRIAVIINEFGEVGIDHYLLFSSAQEVVQMNNGCLCCTVRGDLVRSFFQLIEHRSEFDHVVIETSGLAEPGPIAQSIYSDERIRSEFAPAGIVTVVDAKHILKRLAESAEAREQVALADMIVLNKTDLSTPEELDETERELARVNGVARVERARHSEIDLSLVFELDSDGLSGGREALSAEGHDRLEDSDHHHADDHHYDHHHLSDIETVCIERTGALDGVKVSAWFQKLVAESAERILRMKGVLNLSGDDEQFLLQGVHSDFGGRPGRRWEDGEERTNRLVFIGRGLDRETLLRGFESCLHTGETKAASVPHGEEEISPYTLEQIRYWMRQNFNYPKHIPIVIKEVPCVKQECPPIETSILAMEENAPPRVFKVQKPIKEITFNHIYDLIENPLPCC